MATLLTEEEEVRVLKSLVRGHHSKEIAVELDVLEEDVRTAIQSILTKLLVHSRLEEATGGKSELPSWAAPGASAA